VDKALRDRLETKKFNNMSPEELREAALFTLKALKAYIEEVNPDCDADISTISQAIPILKIYLGD
jgi:hypothetical protein